MGLFNSHAAKAESALDKAKNERLFCEQRLAAHLASAPSGENSEEAYQWEKEKLDYELRLKVARGAVQYQEGKAAELAAEAAEKAADARHAEMGRKVKAAEKRVRAIEDLQRKLAAERDWLKAHVEEVTKYNESERGKRTGFVDAEQAVRFQEAIPSNYVPLTGEVWLDSQGRQVGDTIMMNGVCLPRNMDGFRKVQRQCGVTGGGGRSAHMPERWSTAIQLTDITGNPL